MASDINPWIPILLPIMAAPALFAWQAARAANKADITAIKDRQNAFDVRLVKVEVQTDVSWQGLVHKLTRGMTRPTHIEMDLLLEKAELGTLAPDEHIDLLAMATATAGDHSNTATMRNMAAMLQHAMNLRDQEVKDKLDLESKDGA